MKQGSAVTFGSRVQSNDVEARSCRTRGMLYSDQDLGSQIRPYLFKAYHFKAFGRMLENIGIFGSVQRLGRRIQSFLLKAGFGTTLKKRDSADPSGYWVRFNVWEAAFGRISGKLGSFVPLGSRIRQHLWEARFCHTFGKSGLAVILGSPVQPYLWKIGRQRIGTRWRGTHLKLKQKIRNTIILEIRQKFCNYEFLINLQENS